LSKKKVALRSMPRGPKPMQELYSQRIVEIDDRVCSLFRAGAHVVFIDEAIFTARGYS
jgi:hypothetical protein